MNQILLSFDRQTGAAFETPIPVDVFNERLARVATPVVQLSNQAQLVDVPGPGRYFVRAELPSGESLSGMVEVEGTEAALTLQAEERSPSEALSWAYARQSVRHASRVSGHWRLSETGMSAVETDVPLKPVFLVSLAGVFRASAFRDAWSLERAESSTSFRLTNEDRGVAQVDKRLLLSVSLSRVFYDVEKDWFPLYLRYESTLLRHDWMLAIPPSLQATLLLVRADTDEQSYAWCRPLVASGRPGAEALLAYMERGSVGSARRVAPKIIEQAFSLLEDKGGDPVSAAIAGYFLLQLGRGHRTDWLENLARSFPTFPDASVVYGVSLLRGEITAAGTGTAREYLVKAVNSGIPVYTIGLRLLFDSLQRLVRQDSRDEELCQALAKVRVVAAYADWGATTTSFAVPPPDLDLPFWLR
jgi:hypothetical protein